MYTSLDDQGGAATLSCMCSIWHKYHRLLKKDWDKERKCIIVWDSNLSTLHYYCCHRLIQILQSRTRSVCASWSSSRGNEIFARHILKPIKPWSSCMTCPWVHRPVREPDESHARISATFHINSVVTCFNMFMLLSRKALSHSPFSKSDQVSCPDLPLINSYTAEVVKRGARLQDCSMQGIQTKLKDSNVF